MIVKEADYSFENYELQMILHNEIPCLLEMQIIMGDGKVEYWYDVTGMLSLEKQFSLEEINEKTLRFVLQNLIEMKHVMEEYLLDDRNLCLTSSMIFYDRFARRLRFCYIPGFGGENCGDVKDLFTDILENLNHLDPAAVKIGYDMYDRCMKSDFLVEDARECLRGRSVNSAAEADSEAKRKDQERSYREDSGDEQAFSANRNREVLQEPTAGWKYGERRVESAGQNFGNNRGLFTDREKKSLTRDAEIGSYAASRQVRPEKEKQWRENMRFNPQSNEWEERAAPVEPHREQAELPETGDKAFEAGKRSARVSEQNSNAAESARRAAYKESRHTEVYGAKDSLHEGSGGRHADASCPQYYGTGESAPPSSLNGKEKKKAGWRMRKKERKQEAVDYGRLLETEQKPVYVAEPDPEPEYTECFSAGNRKDVWELLYKGDGVEQDIPLASFPFFVGTSAGKVQGLLHARTVSRVHARFFLSEGKLFVEDYNSTNGTYVNQKILPLNTPQELHAGDQIVFATEEYLVCCRKENLEFRRSIC